MYGEHGLLFTQLILPPFPCLLSSEQGHRRWTFPVQWPRVSVLCFRCWMSPLFRLTLNGSHGNGPSISPQPMSFSSKLADFRLLAPTLFAGGFSLLAGAYSSQSAVVGNQYFSRAALKHFSGNDWQLGVAKNTSALFSWITLRRVFHIGPSSLQQQLSSVIICLITHFFY